MLQDALRSSAQQQHADSKALSNTTAIHHAIEPDGHVRQEFLETYLPMTIDSL